MARRIRQTLETKLGLSGMSKSPETIRIAEKIREAKETQAKALDLSGLLRPEGDPNLSLAIPMELFELEQLEILNLANNGLSALPAEIGQLQNLKELILEVNQLSTLPAEFFHLTHLEKVNLDNNRLSVVPDGIGRLQNLSELRLKLNLLTSISDEIGTLQKLTTLSLQRLGTEHVKLPPSMNQLTHLRSLLLLNFA
jgi:internalin A